MQAISATLIIIYISMLNCSLKKYLVIPKSGTMRKKIDILLNTSGKIMKFYLEIKKKLWNFIMRNLGCDTTLKLR